MEGQGPSASRTTGRRSDRHSRRRSVEAGGGSRSLWVFAAAMLVLVALRPTIADLLSEQPMVATWLTVFVSICLQALPFLVFGVLLSALIATVVPASAPARVLPRHPAAAVPVAALGGTVLPGCECASVPIAGALVRRGSRPRSR